MEAELESKKNSPLQQHDVGFRTAAAKERFMRKKLSVGGLTLDTNLERTTPGSDESTLEPDSGIFLENIFGLNHESNLMMPAQLAPPPTPRPIKASLAAYEHAPMVPYPGAPPQTPRPTQASLALHESALAAAQQAPKNRSPNVFRNAMSSSRTHTGAANAGADEDDTRGLAPRAHCLLDGANESQYSLTGKAGRRIAPDHIHSWLVRHSYGMTDEELDDVYYAGQESFRDAFDGVSSETSTR